MLGIVLDFLQFGKLRLAVDIVLHLLDEPLGLSDPLTGRLGDDREPFRTEYHQSDNATDYEFTETEIKHKCLTSRWQKWNNPRSSVGRGSMSERLRRIRPASFLQEPFLP